MSETTGSVKGVPRVLLQLEGAAVLILAVALFVRSNGSWWLFGALILAPDLGLLAYFAGSRSGAIAYNALHTYVGPVLLVALCEGVGVGTQAALVWAAHIGMDRSIGLGLKYGSGFRHTHLRGAAGNKAGRPSAQSLA